MSLFFILLLLALIVGGYFIYQRLRTIEREIRADQAAMSEQQDAEPSPAPEPPEVKSTEKGIELVASSEPEGGLVEQVLKLVEEMPGLAQTEIYSRFDASDRRELQKQLRLLDQQGKLRREKKGNSYRLYPI